MPQKVLEHLSADQPNALARLQQFLSIPSVSTDPAYKAGIYEAARWLCTRLESLGLEVKIHQTAGHPVVLAHTRPEDVMSPKAPRLLFYGHYDVQPPDPLDLWTTPPFVPDIRDCAIYARGASDDKGQVLCFVEALAAWRQIHNRFPLPITVLIEGEEEMGSPSLAAFLKQHKEELKADICLVSDTTMWDRHTPAITYGLRGLLYFDLQLHGPNRDLHSGVYGGTLANPATVLTEVLGRLFDEDHRITIPGFYDDVAEVSAAEKEQWASLKFNDHEFLGAVGMREPYGEVDYDTLTRRWARPSCDINGLYGGYGGPGAKTIIPSFAGAKVSFRVAPNQKAARIAKAFEIWLRDQDVHGCSWKITELSGSDPVVVPTDSPYLTAARRAIEQGMGKPPVLVRDGATIPVVGDFKRILNLDTLLIGYGLADDRIHSPNEKFDLECFRLGCRTDALLLAELARG